MSKTTNLFLQKVEILRILTFHFLPDLLPKVGQSPENVSFSTHTETHIQPIREIFMKTQRFFKRESTYSVKWIFHGSSESKFIKL